jgi:hypothetical protein
MRGYWRFETRRGTFRIEPSGNGRFDLIFEDDTLDNHASPSAAAEAAAEGTCIWPSFGNPASLGIPADVSEWTFIPCA